MVGLARGCCSPRRGSQPERAKPPTTFHRTARSRLGAVPGHARAVVSGTFGWLSGALLGSS
eukprot:15482328-Alexandrium_andersonii.AAC.1